MKGLVRRNILGAALSTARLAVVFVVTFFTIGMGDDLFANAVAQKIFANNNITTVIGFAFAFATINEIFQLFAGIISGKTENVQKNIIGIAVGIVLTVGWKPLLQLVFPGI